MTIKEMKEFSRRVNSLLFKEEWKTLDKILRDRLKSYPNEYWLMTCLANSLYEQRKYKQALKYSEKAMQIASDDPLVIFDYAPILKMTGDIRKAIGYWKKIEKMGLNRLAFGRHGEGMNWAKSIRNTTYYQLAFAYKDLGDMKNLITTKKNIENRERGVRCNYSKAETLRLYKEYF